MSVHAQRVKTWLSSAARVIGRIHERQARLQPQRPNPICGRCSKPHSRGKSRWQRAELARLGWSGRLPVEALGDMPASFKLAEYPGKESKAPCGILELSWTDYASWCWGRAQQIVPKGTGSIITNYPRNEEGRRLESNLGSIHRVYFDSDDAGLWDPLMAEFSTAGLSAIFSDSSSCKPGHWHVEIPLAVPLVGPLDRAAYKAQYHHIAGILSKLAGFGGVGGHCGFDLAPAQVLIPRFPGSRRSPESPTPRVVHLEGRALDWENFLSATGYVPPEPKPEPVDRSKPRVIQTKQGSIAYQKGSDLLVVEVRQRVDMATFLAQLGRDRKTGDKYACPIHEPEGGALSFHIHIADRLGPSHWRYECFGDCAETRYGSGDVIHLAATLWGTNYKQALHRLARENGLKIADFRSSVRSKAPLSPRAHVRLSRWTAAMLPRTEKPMNALRALAKVFFSFDMDYARAAATLWKACQRSAQRFGKDDVYTSIAEVLDRVQKGHQTVGMAWLRRTFGLSAMRNLGELIAKAIGGRVTEAITATCGFTRYQIWDDQRTVLREAFISLPRPSSVSEKRESVRAMMRAPTACKHFTTEVWGDGRKNGEIQLPCRVQQICPACCLVRTNGSHSIVTGDVVCRDCDGCLANERCRYSWRGRGPFYSVSIRVPREHLDDIKKKINRKGEAKLQAVGTCLETGLPVLLYVTANKTSAGVIRSAALCWSSVTGIRLEITRHKSCDHETAARWVFDAQHSVQLYTDQLLRARNSDELIAYLGWMKGKQLVVSRSKRGLPWPSREVVREATRSDDQDDLRLYPGQRLTYKLVHVETGYVLGERSEGMGPCSIGQAITIAQHSEALSLLTEALRQTGARTRTVC